MKQSIIIPFHKNKDMLLYCLKTLEKTIPSDIEIVIIGNNAKSEEIDFQLPEKYIYYKIYKNIQYPNAVNYGVMQCKGEIITICDPDVFFWDDWYTPMLDFITQKENVGAVSLKLINPLNNRILDFGMYYTKYNAIHSTMGLKYDHPLTMFDRKVQTACSAVMMTTRSAFQKVNGMDPELPFSYTECDYCLKLKRIGLDTWVISNSKAYHKGNTDPNNSKNYAFKYYKTDSKAIFAYKNYGYLQYDVENWFEISCSFAKKHINSLQTKYLLLDFSTIYDREEYYNLIKEKLSIDFLDCCNVVVKSRNISSLPLYNYISFKYIDYASPILYFVDIFTCLFDNELWFKMRDISRDLVVDRHGNIFPLIDIAEHRC